jgi:hypothetical protein
MPCIEKAYQERIELPVMFRQILLVTDVLHLHVALTALAIGKPAKMNDVRLRDKVDV